MRLPLINARTLRISERRARASERGGVDNWNYVKKALVRKVERVEAFEKKAALSSRDGCN